MWHIVGIHESSDKNRSRPTDCVIAWCFETSLVNGIDLISLIRIPTRANKTGTERVPVVENNFSHNSGSRLDRWEVAKLSSLDVNVVPNVLANGTSVWWGSRSLSINSLMQRFQFIRAFVSNKHWLYEILIIWLINKKYIRLKIYRLRPWGFRRHIWLR